jgi:hypothetical protein
VLLGVVEGGYNIGARIDAARKMAACTEAQGYVIDGLHNNGASVEDISYNTIRPVIVETLVSLQTIIVFSYTLLCVHIKNKCKKSRYLIFAKFEERRTERS